MTLADKIRERGYWQITVRPSKYEPERIPDLSELFPILQKSYVSHKGLDFPPLNSIETVERGLDWIAQEFEFSHLLSSWRFYQSGLFILLFGIPDDWRDQSSWWIAPEDWAPQTSLGAGEAMLVFVDSFEFAARIAQTAAGGDSMHVEVKIVNLEGRQLYMDVRRKWGFFRPYVATLNEFPYSKTLTRTVLLATPRESAIAGAAELFKRFGWERPVEDFASLFEDFLRR